MIWPGLLSMFVRIPRALEKNVSSLQQVSSREMKLTQRTANTVCVALAAAVLVLLRGRGSNTVRLHLITWNVCEGRVRAEHARALRSWVGAGEQARIYMNAYWNCR